MPWTAPVPATAGQIMTAAFLNAQLYGNFVAVQAGTIALTQVTLDGAASDPAVSPAGDAVIAYNTTLGLLRRSVNGGAFEDLAPSQGDIKLLTESFGR